MKNFFDAYRERLQRNQAALEDLIKEVLILEPETEVYVHRDYPKTYLSAVYFFKHEEGKEEKINIIRFHEVPYSWSGCGVKDHAGKENSAMPFTLGDTLSGFWPITKENKTWNKKFRSKSEFLSCYFFLKPYKKYGSNSE